MLDSFQLVLAQSREDGERLARLGAPAVESPGNLKFAARKLAVDEGERRRLGAAIGERPRWLAANTHAGEDDVALALHRRLARPGLLTLIAPRHPERGPAIAQLAEAKGLAIVRRSSGALPHAATDIYLLDTLGEMGLAYDMAPIAFIGGSLVPKGGHNPLEAAHFDTAILIGPDRRNNGAAADALIAAGAALAVDDAESLTREVRALLDEPERRAGLARAASGVVARNQGVLERVLDRLRPHLADRAHA
jgi:3-deoxy-D-manno-octulosonic-acid transferase